MKQETQSATIYWAAACREFLKGLVVFVALLLPFEQIAWADSGLPLVFQRDAQASAELSFGVQLALLETTAKLAQEWGDKSESAGGVTDGDGRFSRPEAGIESQTAEASQVKSIEPIGPDPGKGYVRLPGHVLDALARATPIKPEGVVPLSQGASAAQQQMTLTLVLKRDNQAGFDLYIRDVYDPKSRHYRHFLTQAQIAKRFGPSRRGYEQVLGYLRGNAFKLVEGSKNRMTLTVRAARANVERTFVLNIVDYQIGDSDFFANDNDPAVPKVLASRVEAISGLSDFAEPKPSKTILFLLNILCPITGTGASNASNVFSAIEFVLASVATALNPATLTTGAVAVAVAKGVGTDASKSSVCAMARSYVLQNFIQPELNRLKLVANRPGANAYGNVSKGAKHRKSSIVRRGLATQATGQTVDYAQGTGQTVGLLEFDTFNVSDVGDYLNVFGASSQIGNLSEVSVNGGVSTPGAGEGEVLLDIDTVMAIAPAAKIVVYDAPFNGQAASYSSMFNAMINGGVTVISNSWASCEDQVTLADVQGIDSVLQAAAASGISVFNGAGDAGSTCLDGGANTASVPADSPSATAVGGTSLVMGPGFTYGSETWWDGSNSTPETGQGGFGLSRFFSRPDYQNGTNTSTMRSIPDVVVVGDPGNGGTLICQADDGGCPTGFVNGGTSMSAPIWAAFAALLNEGQGQNLGALNPLIYPFASTDAFHSAASMGSDFEHVGLGSPNLNILNTSLASETIGLPDAGVSQAELLFQSQPVLAGDVLGIAADGTSQGEVLVTLLDTNGNIVSGKTVTLTVSGGSPTVTPSSAVTTVNNGTAVFTVTDLNPETITYTATDTTDNITLTQTAAVTFGVPPAAGGSISALTPTDSADGVTPDTITVTLQDALGRPTRGKQVSLMQSGSSAFTEPTPSVTGSNGQIKFTVTDQANEAVTYTAVDVTDGNLPVPGSAQVTFSNGGGGCPGGSVPSTAAYQVTAFVTGIPTEVSNYSGVFLPCRGADGMAFDASGNFYVADDNTGNIYKFPPSGGVAGSGTLLTKTPLNPGVAGLAFGKDGELYATQVATTGNVYTGAVVQVDTSTGAVVRTVAVGSNSANGLTCAWGLATDPLSGDLFVDDGCIGGGADNPDIWRISNPASANPTVSVYATMPTSGNFDMAFAPDGTLYVTESNGCCGNEFILVTEISGTNTPQPATVTVLPGVTTNNSGYVAMGTQPGGGAKLLVASGPAYIGAGFLGGGLIEYDLTTSPPSQIAVLVPNLAPLNLVQGPDGCIYMASYDQVAKATNADGTCPLVGTTGAPTLILTPVTVSPNPAQGSAQTFNANVHFGSIPAGTPVYFTVVGANPQIQLVNTNASGQAVFTYTAVNSGTDTVVASVSLSGSSSSSSSSGGSSGASSSGTTLTSNQAQVTWVAGQHVTFLTLNPSPTSGTVNLPVNVVASLTDVSANPAVSLANQTVTFTLSNGSTCTAVTNTQGLASCSLTPSQAGSSTLTAAVAASSQYVASTASVGFNVLVVPQSSSSSGAGGSSGSSSSSSSGGSSSSSSSGGGSSGSSSSSSSGGTPPTPLPPVTVKSSGGAVGWPLSLLFGLMAMLRRRRANLRRALVLSLALFAAGSGVARADDSASLVDRLYAGVRFGAMQIGIDKAALKSSLAAAGYSGVQTGNGSTTGAGTVYIGYELMPHADVEFGYTYRQGTTATLSGSEPSASSISPLLQTSAGLVRGYGDIYALSFRERVEFLPGFTFNPRVGAFAWDSNTTASSGGASASSTHAGGGITLGAGLAYRVWCGLELGGGIDYFRGNPYDTGELYAVTAEWRFGKT